MCDKYKFCEIDTPPFVSLGEFTYCIETHTIQKHRIIEYAKGGVIYINPKSKTSFYFPNLCYEDVDLAIIRQTITRPNPK